MYTFTLVVNILEVYYFLTTILGLCLDTWRFNQQIQTFPQSFGLIFKLDINQPKHDNELCFWVPVSIKTSSVLQTVMALMAVLVFLLQHLKLIDNTGIKESTQGRKNFYWLIWILSNNFICDFF